MLTKLAKKGYQVRALHHAQAILTQDMPDVLRELEGALLDLAIPTEELIRGGGGEADLTQRIRRKLSEEHGWKKHNFVVTKVVDGVDRESVSHEIDHVRATQAGVFALEIEWNNKDPFFDRDLENFKRLHADGAISVGAIVTRGDSLQDSMREIVAAFAVRNKLTSVAGIAEYYEPTSRQKRLIAQAEEATGSFADGWARAFVSDKFGEATTHWRKLEERVNRGVGNPCPLLLVGIPKNVVTP